MATYVVDEEVVLHAHEPAERRMRRLELGEPRPGPHAGVLHQVLGIGGIAGQATGGTEEPVEIWLDPGSESLARRFRHPPNPLLPQP